MSSLPSRLADFSLRPVLPGLLIATLTLLLGLGLGVVFGLNEDLIKSRLQASATAVTATVYEGDATKATAVVNKSWSYMQRAHLHGGSLGTMAVALTLVVALLGTGPMLARAVSLALGVGGFGYSFFWLWAGFRAPGLGSTGAAKESLKWLAMPASGLVVIGTATAAVLLFLALLQPDRQR